MIHQRITTTVAMTLTLLASTAPAAFAGSTASPVVRPNPDEQTASNATAITGASCGDVCSGHGYGPVSVTNRVPATVAPCGDVCSGHGYGAVNVSTRAIPSARLSAAAPSSGFDWGDAGIGAGSMLALTVIGVGGVLAASNRRGRHTHQRQAGAAS